MLYRLRTVVRRRARFLALLLTIGILAGAAAGGYAYALRQWHEAQAAIQQERPADARRLLKLCLLVWPRSVPVHVLAARADRLIGDFPSAEAHLNRCLRLQSGDRDAVKLEFLLMRVQTGESDTVAPELWACVEHKHPETPLILRTLARAYMHDLRYGTALTCLDRWIQEEPTAAEPLYWKGWVLERLHASADALAAYQKALELDPNHVAVRLRLAEIYMDKAEPPTALTHLEHLRRQCPDRADVQARLGQCYFLLGRVEEARPLLAGAVERLPNDTAVLITLAKLELQDDHPAEAEKWLRRALKVDPFDTEAEYTLSTCLQSEGRREEAASALVECHRKRALLQKADKLLDGLAAGRSGDDPGTLAEVGSVLLQLGQDSQGLYWLDQALRLDPGHRAAHKALADYYQGKGDNDKAAAHRRFLAAPPRPTAAR